MAATNAQMATWLIANKDKKGTADFETVARHYTANMAAPTDGGAAPTPAAPATPEGYTSSAGGYGTEALKGVANLASGVLESTGQGMTSVGRILGLESPEDSAARREAITQGLQTLGNYEPESTSTSAGRFLGTTGLTAGMPSALAKTVSKIPVVNALAPKVINYLSPAFESAGFGNGLSIGQRVVGGAIPGAATGAVVSDDPVSGALTGAALGGTLPMAIPLTKGALAVGAAIGAVVSDDPVSGALTGAALGGTLPIAIPLTKGALAVAKPVARGIYGSVEPLFEKGGQAVKNRIISQAFGGDEVQMQQALDMLDKGATLKDIAIQFNNPTLAGLANAAERLPFADISGAYAEKAGAKNVAAINQLSGAEAFANKAAADARATQVSETAKAFPQQDMEALGRKARVAAESVRIAARDKTKAAYDATDAIGETLPPMEAPGIFEEAKNIIGEDGFGGNVPELASVLSGMEKRATAAKAAAKAASPNTYQFPFGGQPIEKSIPLLTFNELTSIIKAINTDIGQVGSIPALRPKLRNLIKLRRSVEKFIADAPEKVISKEAKDALKNATEVYKTEFSRKFKVGKTQSNMLLDRNGAPVIADEKVIANFFKPNSPSAARRFVDMLGGNPAAYDAMEKGILETFRSKVVKNGVIDQNAYTGFIENYRAPLKVLEDAGVDVSAITNKEASLGALGKAADSAESLAAEAKALQTRYNADPNKVVADIVKDIPEAQAIVDKIRKEIANSKVFDDLVSQGGVGAGLLKQEPISVLPTGHDVFTKLLTWTARRLSGGALDKQTRDIAIGLMNETATKDLIKRSMQASPSGYEKTGERVKKALAPRPPPRMNNLGTNP